MAAAKVAVTIDLLSYFRGVARAIYVQPPGLAYGREPVAVRGPLA